MDECAHFSNTIFKLLSSLKFTELPESRNRTFDWTGDASVVGANGHAKAKQQRACSNVEASPRRVARTTESADQYLASVCGIMAMPFFSRVLPYRIGQWHSCFLHRSPTRLSSVLLFLFALHAIGSSTRSSDDISALFRNGKVGLACPAWYQVINPIMTSCSPRSPFPSIALLLLDYTLLC